MKKLTIVPVLALVLLFCARAGHAQQQPDKQKQTRLMQAFYSRILQIDSVKAAQVSQIQDSYKTSLRAVTADTSLNEAARRAKINVLIGEKNRQLKLLLTPAQQEKVIPTTERTPSKKATLN